MNITKVKYERLFPCGAYLNEKIGFEAELGSRPMEGQPIDGVTFMTNETPEQVINELRQLAESIHKEKYPHFYNSDGLQKEQDFIPETINIKEPKDERVQSFIATINMCTSKKFLENFRTRVVEENNDALTEAYNNKLKTFE